MLDLLMPAARQPAPNSKVGDRIISVGGTVIDSPSKLLATTKSNAGKTVAVVAEHDGKRSVVTVHLRQTSPYMGVAPQSGEEGFEVRRSTWSAPIVAIGVGKDFTIATVKGLGTAIKGLGSIIAGTFTGNSRSPYQRPNRRQQPIIRSDRHYEDRL